MKKLFVLLSLFTLLFVSCFSSDDDEPAPYSLIVKGYDGASLTTFTGNYLLLNGTDDWHTYRVISDSLVIEVEDTGTYILTAGKSGYVSTPEVDTVEVTDFIPTARPTFHFAEDTSGGTEPDYSVTISGSMGGSPTEDSISFQIILSKDEWHSDSILFCTDSLIIELEESGTYIVTAVKEGYYVNPSSETFTIYDESPAARVDFIFFPIGNFGFWVFGEFEGSPTTFKCSYRYNHPDSVKHEQDLFSGGYVPIAGPGRYVVAAEKNAFSVYPSEYRQNVTEIDKVDSIFFTFADTISPLSAYTLMIEGSLYGSPISFEGMYTHIQSGHTVEYSVDETGDLELEFFSPCDVIVTADHTDYKVSPSVDTVHFTEDEHLKLSSFEFSYKPVLLAVQGTLDGSSTSFSGYYEKLDESSIIDHFVIDDSGIDTFTLPEPAEYLVAVEKRGFFVEPIADTVTLVRSNSPVVSSFEFTEDITDYTLTLIGRLLDVHTPLAFRARLQHDVYDTETFEVGPEGFATFSVPSSGEYTIIADKEGFLPLTEEIDISLSPVHSSETVIFTFEDESFIEYPIRVSGDQSDFSFKWRAADRYEDWHSVSVEDSGRCIITVTGTNDYLFKGEKEGFYSPYASCNVSGHSSLHNVHLDFIEDDDSCSFLICIAEASGERADFILYYRINLPGMHWSSPIDVPSGTSVELPNRLRYELRLVKEGYETIERFLYLGTERINRLYFEFSE